MQEYKTIVHRYNQETKEYHIFNFDVNAINSFEAKSMALSLCKAQNVLRDEPFYYVNYSVDILTN